MKRNPYRIEIPSILSFSGGRSSGYLLNKVLEAFDWVMPDHIKVYFANTGKEMEQTLKFVKDCQDKWDVPITWVELAGAECEIKKTGRKYTYGTKEVDFETASRKGEPFDHLLSVRNYLPSPVQRFCTSELKIRRIVEHANYHGIEHDFHIVGIRADERRRAAKILAGDKDEGHIRIIPLYDAGVTKEEVGDFWKNQDFDLELPNNNGTTDWGNCDLCMLKGMKKKLSIIREQPELADWWIEKEEQYSRFFRKDEPSYRDKKRIALQNDDMFQGQPDFDNLGCYCGD